MQNFLDDMLTDHWLRSPPWPALGPAHCQPLDLDGWEAHAYGDRLTVLPARPNSLVQLQVIAHHGYSSENIRAVADQRGAPDRLCDLSVLDHVGLAGRKDELAARDVHLAAAEGHGVQAVLDGPDDLLWRRVARQHEGVGHAWERLIGIALASAVACGFHSHQARIQSILQIPPQDPALDQDRTSGRGSLVIDIQRATASWDRAIVHHGDKWRAHLLPDPIGEGRGLLPVEVAFKAVADCFVQQDPGPSGAEDDVHRSGRGVGCAEVHDGQAGGLLGVELEAAPLQEELKVGPAASAPAPYLPVLALLGDAGDVQA